MCTVCGCGAGETRVSGASSGQHSHAHAHGHHHAHDHPDGHDHGHGHGHDHHHGHAHHHDHDHGHAVEAPLHFGHGPAGVSVAGEAQTRLIAIEQDILSKNAGFAAHNRRHFQGHGVVALNLMSSPGAGKTTLLVRTLTELAGSVPVAVIEGDQETSADAERIRATGVPAVQVNTGKGCHLDADMVGTAFDRLHDDLHDGGLLFIENVGNLVCPSAFDLGESFRVVIASVTEGEDKPLKYPNMFASSQLMIVSKVDLLPHLDFDVDLLIANARRINPALQVLKVSARTGEGMDRWLVWLRAAVALRQAAE